jgi:hypothetical protein
MVAPDFKRPMDAANIRCGSHCCTRREVLSEPLRDDQPVPQWIAARPELPRHGFINDGNRKRIPPVPVREHAAANQGNFKRIEIRGRDGLPAPVAARRIGVLRTAHDRDRQAIGIAFER